MFKFSTAGRSNPQYGVQIRRYTRLDDFLLGQCSRKAIGPSEDIAGDFAKYLMIYSKSSDSMSDDIKTVS